MNTNERKQYKVSDTGCTEMYSFIYFFNNPKDILLVRKHFELNALGNLRSQNRLNQILLGLDMYISKNIEDC